MYGCCSNILGVFLYKIFVFNFEYWWGNRIKVLCVSSQYVNTFEGKIIM